MGRMVRIYQPGTYLPEQIYALSSEAMHHISVVLRMQRGDTLVLFNGDNWEYEAIIEEVHKKKVTVKIKSVCLQNRESPRKIHLGQAISKGDRMEWIVQKAVELGVASITPLITAHCAVKMDTARIVKKVNQWQAIVIAACEQCGRNEIPLLREPLFLDEYLQKCQATYKLILHPQKSKNWRDYAFDKGDIALLIGPEGGFSESECQTSQEAGFSSLYLGPRILRTETAAIVAISLLQAIAGDL